MKSRENKIVVFAGPSGSGKDAIIEKIIEKSDNIVRLTNATTREKRVGEIDGEMYYFLSEKEFKKGIKDGLIPEHNIHASNYYGAYLPDLHKKLKQNKIIFVQTQLVGARYFKEEHKTPTLFFLADSLEVLENRIRNRSDLSEEEIIDRLKIAKREIEEESKFYDYIVENKEGKLDETVKKVLEILKKEGIDI